ncbi:MAG: adenylosuccinate synthase [Bacteroidales bacterium]|nr:adenylosuccinate synthase [Bacteroidales bacterium]MBQ2912945.1 adenylosuccinate synthase [Bacteroidales bacterium]MBQ7018924.1 adenylosuccinate synthase [Bacteroidales bacterium]MBR2478187.1 adenylosuccinate synthase [Bacteroidales bacterium]
MKVDVVLGLQWGDEGKGKIVDVLANSYPVIARFQGGPNAGHSLHFEGKKFVLHTVPSGVFRKNAVNIIGNGVVIDPIIFKEECMEIEATGVPVRERVVISKKAHLILPTHRIIDAASEAAKGKSKIGSTLKGIGPTYMDKTGRAGLRVGDILAADFADRFLTLKNKHIAYLTQYDYEYNAEEKESEWMEAIEYLKTFKLVDGEYVANKYLAENKKILAEGAQGTMLDVDFGSYPFVTSSSTTCAGVCTGLGVAPTKIGKVYGIFKAYCTRVGSGPFPTELNDETGEELRKKGFEFGATTGRPRRTGWLDLPALKYAIMLDGVTELIMMKADVLDTFDTIKVATGYKVDGVETDQVPYDTYAEIEPIYKEFKGWNKDLSQITREEELPFEFMNYVRFIEKELNVPISVISLGPDRVQTIFRNEE